MKLLSSIIFLIGVLSAVHCYRDDDFLLDAPVPPNAMLCFQYCSQPERRLSGSFNFHTKLCFCKTPDGRLLHTVIVRPLKQITAGQDLDADDCEDVTYSIEPYVAK